MRLSLPFTVLACACFLLVSACDSTPRERQAAVRQEARALDTLARTGGRKLARLGQSAASYQSAARTRRAEPLDPRRTIAMEQALLGTTGQLDTLTPTTIAAAYTQLIRETRHRRATWTLRDWDYARAVYQRLNTRLKQIRLDLPARDELRIRSRQAEFVALQAGHAAHEINTAARQLPR